MGVLCEEKITRKPTTNKYMGGVDRMDENIARYRISIRSRKWWWTTFILYIDTAIHNGWQVHRHYVDESAKMDYIVVGGRPQIVQANRK